MPLFQLQVDDEVFETGTAYNLLPTLQHAIDAAKEVVKENAGEYEFEFHILEVSKVHKLTSTVTIQDTLEM